MAIRQFLSASRLAFVLLVLSGSLGAADKSQRQAFEAQLSLSETTQQLFNGYVKLYKALGGGWLSEQEMIEAQQAAEEAAQEDGN